MNDNLTSKMTFLPDAIEIAAQCWCEPTTRALVMQPQVAEVFADRLAAQMNAAAQARRDASFYQDVVCRAIRALGHDPDVLAATDLPAVLTERLLYLAVVEGNLKHAEEIAEARRVGAENLNLKYLEAVSLLREADRAMAPVELRQRITDFVATTTPDAEKYT